MGKPINNLKQFKGAGMDLDTSYENIAPNDIISAYNFRSTGTGQNETFYLTNPESTQLISQSLPEGINKGIGGGSFEDKACIIFWRYNSAGFNQIVRYDKSTQVETVLFTDITDSGGDPIMPLDPQEYVKAILINEIFLIWAAKNSEVGYTNLDALTNGVYGTVIAEDLSLLKPQGLPPITGTYGSDAGQPANYLYSRLPQFNYQYVNSDFNYSAWSTWSKRVVPYQENTPTLGADVTQNNYIVVSVNAGSIRATTLNIAARFGTEIFAIIRSVDRSYYTALPHTSVDVSTEVYEAYNPITNIYSFAYYNNDISIPVPATETDLAYDYIWPSNTLEKINGNILAIADWTTQYARPNTSVTVTAVGYDPNIDIPAGTYPDPLLDRGNFNGASGSGAGGHRRIMWIQLSGTPHTGDTVVIITADVRNATATRNYTYVVPAAQDGNLAAVVASISATVTGSYSLTAGVYRITFTDLPYYGLQVFGVKLFFAGAAVANSIPTILDDSSGQVALSYRDKWGRFLPLCTNNLYKYHSPSYAQVNGNAISLTVQINDVAAPAGAVDYQILLSKPPVDNIVESTAIMLNYKGGWDARANTPTLAVNVGTVGDTYQITTPDTTTDASYHNLGSGADYKTGDYVTYNGQSWDILPKSFGDLTATGNILAFSLNPLSLFNSQYATQGVSTVLGYDFSQGGRCTLHYYLDGAGNPVYINSPCVNLSVFGFDAATYIVKVEKSATFDVSVLAGTNTFLRLYSPAPQLQSASTTLDGTVFYEIGDRHTITNGNHDDLNITIYDGGAYFKTRQFADAVLPYTNPPVDVLATDLNYSDFYPSEFSSFGRARTYNDELPQTERKASIITSQPFILGSKVNGLTRFYPANVYGDANGQTSSSQGAIGVLWQRGNTLVVGQELNFFYIPVNEAYTVLNDQLTGQSISEKLLNNGRYERKGLGIGTLKESFCYKNDIAYFINPFQSEPFEIGLNGVVPISAQMVKYFRGAIALAYSQGKKIVQFYNMYYDEVMMCIETDGGVLTAFPFTDIDWNPFNNYVIVPGDVSATPNGSHCTASYNGATGVVTYTPTPGYVGTDQASFTFDPGTGPITLNNCLAWIAGSTTVNAFVFNPASGQPLSTYILSNTIVVSGPTIAVAISISGGSGRYSINGGAFTASAGTTVSGDVIQVKVMSSGSNSTATSTTLTIGATTGTFTATTLASSSAHYMLSALYNMKIVSATDGTCTGTPAAFGTANLASGNNLSAVYTSITAGTVSVVLTGTPAIPGHVRLALYVAGVSISTAIVPSAGTYLLTFAGTTNDPTTILIALESF